MKDTATVAVHDVLDGDEVRSVLHERFYRPEAPPRAAAKPRRRKPRPEHYQVICISMYREDLERLDRKVAELKRSGFRKMSRSAFIRFALDTVYESKLPKGY